MLSLTTVIQPSISPLNHFAAAAQFLSSLTSLKKNSKDIVTINIS
jgi:hypothetical protein